MLERRKGESPHNIKYLLCSAISTSVTKLVFWIVSIVKLTNVMCHEKCSKTLII